MNFQGKTITFYGTLILVVAAFFTVWSCAEPKLEEIKITPSEQTLTIGESIDFEAEAMSDKDTKMPGVTFQWMLEGDVGTIDNSGRFTAQKPGEGQVVAKAGSITGTVKVIVKPPSVAVIEVSPEKDRSLPESKVSVTVKGLTADGRPAAYNEVHVSVLTAGASSSEKVLSLDDQGKAQVEITLSKEPGANSVAFQSGDVKEAVQLEGTTISQLRIMPDRSDFEVGETAVFKAIGADEYGNERPVEVEWSLIGESARIVDGGKVEMKQPGKGILLAKFEKMKQGRPFRIVPGNLAKLVLTPENVEIDAGDSTNFSVEGFNAHGYKVTAKVHWQVEGDMGTIEQDGAFRAEKAGKGAVQAISGEVVAESPVTVKHGPLAGIRIDIAEKKLQAGQKIALKAEGVDAYGNPFPVSPEWFLSKSLGSIDRKEGTFTALHTGTGEIRAKIGNILESIPIEIVPAELARLELIPKSVDLIAGDTVQFEVSGFDRYKNTVTVDPVYSIDDALGSLNETGVFAAEKAGSTSVRVSAGKLAEESTVAVAPAEMEKAVIEPAGSVELKAGQAREFKAFGLDSFGNTVKSTVSWQVHPELGAMDAQGVFYPKKAGKGQIVAEITQLRTQKTLQTKAAVRVAPGETTHIDLEPADLETRAGKETRFAAAAYDQFGNETRARLNWRVEDAALGEITQEGVFKAIKSGSGKVIASHKNVSSAADIEIQPAKIAFLKIIPERFSVKAGEKAKIKAIGEDRFGNRVDAEILWSLSEASLGEVESDGVLVARKQGEGRLIATAGNIVDTVPIKVEKGPLALIQVIPKEQSVASGAKIRFAAEGFDAGGNKVQIDPNWSADAPLGSIQSNGVFEAEKVGQGKVSAVSGDVVGSAKITVVPGKPTSIDLTPKTLKITAGEAAQLTLKVYDAHENLIENPEYRWEVEKNVGEIDAQNAFHAMKAGTGFIQLVSGRANAQIAVTVERGKVDAIEIEPKTVDTRAGASVDFTAKAFDSEGNELTLQAKWSVSNGIGEITENGRFQALRVGRGHVSVQMEDVAGVAPIRVEPGPVSRVKVQPAAVERKAGSSVDFTATAFDAHGNRVPAEIEWSLEADKALGEITSTGTLTALKSGDGFVVATVDDVKGTGAVTVKPGALVKLIVSPEPLVLNSGQRANLSVKGEDSYGNEVSVKPDFSLQPPELGTFTAEGVLLGKKVGKGVLIASLNGLQGSTPVLVKTGILTQLKIEFPEEKIMAGNTYRIKAAGYDTGGNPVPVEPMWAVTPNVGEMEQMTGVFHAGKVGKGLVTARSGKIVTESPIEVYPGKLYSLFIEPNPVTVQSNNIQAFEIKGFDVKENQVNVSESAMDWNVVGGIGVFEAPGTFHGTKMGKGKVTAGTGSLLAEAYVTVIPGTADMYNSRVRATYPLLPADGESFSEVIVEVRDLYNNPVSDVQVTLISNRQNDAVEQPPKTDVKGLARGKIRSNNPGTAVISAVVKGKTFLDTEKVTFE